MFTILPQYFGEVQYFPVVLSLKNTEKFSALAKNQRYVPVLVIPTNANSCSLSLVCKSSISYVGTQYIPTPPPWPWICASMDAPKDELKVIYDYARELGIICFATPFDVKSVNVLEELDNPIYKIASFHVTDLELIESIAKTSKPILP